MWEVEGTDEFAAWYGGLTDAQAGAVDASVEFLEDLGPALGRPLVDTLHGSRHANMKELRPRGGYLRILFAFDPRRTAILLLGGDKRGQWSAWYDAAVPAADDLYDEHLATLRTEGAIE